MHMCGLVGSVASRVVHWVSHDKQVTVGCLLVHGCFDENRSSCALAKAVGAQIELELCDLTSS